MDRSDSVATVILEVSRLQTKATEKEKLLRRNYHPLRKTLVETQSSSTERREILERQKETIARKGAVIDALYTVINWHQEDCHRLRSALAQDLANKTGKFELHKTALVVADSTYNKLKDAAPDFLQELQGLEAEHKKLNEVHTASSLEIESLKASLEQSTRAMIAHDLQHKPA